MSELQSMENSQSNNIVAKNSEAPSPLDVVEVKESAGEAPDNSAPEQAEVAAQDVDKRADASSDGELPEFAKRRLGREQKKYDREISRLRAELEQERIRNNPASANYNMPPQGGNVYQDPITGKYIDLNTPEGQAIYTYHQEMSQVLNAQEKQQQELQQKDADYKLFAHFEDSFENAKDKYNDFEKVIKNSGMTPQIAKELATFPDPGELGYYLASNPREVERLQKLPAHEMKRELLKHMAEMVSKNNITRTPPPIKTSSGVASTPLKSFSQKSYAELKAERRNQLRGSR